MSLFKDKVESTWMDEDSSRNRRLKHGSEEDRGPFVSEYGACFHSVNVDTSMHLVFKQLTLSHIKRIPLLIDISV